MRAARCTECAARVAMVPVRNREKLLRRFAEASGVARPPVCRTGLIPLVAPRGMGWPWEGLGDAPNQASGWPQGGVFAHFRSRVLGYALTFVRASGTGFQPVSVRRSAPLQRRVGNDSTGPALLIGSVGMRFAGMAWG